MAMSSVLTLKLPLAPSGDNSGDILELTFFNEQVDHVSAIELLNAEAFGPARFTRAAHIIREVGGHDPNLSFVTMLGDRVIGTIRMTPIWIGNVPSYLLGPIVVANDFKSLGLGSKLMALAIEAAEKNACRLILLVGDEPYYRRFGFKTVLEGQMTMPAPVNPKRFLALELENGACQSACGIVRHRCVKNYS